MHISNAKLPLETESRLEPFVDRVEANPAWLVRSEPTVAATGDTGRGRHSPCDAQMHARRAH